MLWAPAEIALRLRAAQPLAQRVTPSSAAISLADTICSARYRAPTRLAKAGAIWSRRYNLIAPAAAQAST